MAQTIFFMRGLHRIWAQDYVAFAFISHSDSAHHSPVLQPSSPPSSGQRGPLLPSSLPPSSPLPHAGVVWLVPSPILSCAVPVPHVAWQSQQTSSPYLQEKEVATFHVHKNMWATKLTIAYVITEPLKHIWLLSNILQQLYYKSCSTNSTCSNSSTNHLADQYLGSLLYV